MPPVIVLCSIFAVSICGGLRFAKIIHPTNCIALTSKQTRKLLWLVTVRKHLENALPRRRNRNDETGILGCGTWRERAPYGRSECAEHDLDQPRHCRGGHHRQRAGVQRLRLHREQCLASL